MSMEQPVYKFYPRKSEAKLADRIAYAWLKFADKVIAEGGKPAKLSALMAQKMYLESHIYEFEHEESGREGYRLNNAAAERVKSLAKSYTVQALNRKEFPAVLAWLNKP